MKYLFLLLVLTNIVFYLWETGMGQPATQQTSTPPATERIERVKDQAKPTASQVAEAQPASPEPPAQGQPAQAEICRQIGPYRSVKQARTALSALPADYQGRVVKKTVEVENGYSILYPAADDLETAQANQQMLLEQGFEEASLVGNTVVLTVVRDKKQADETVREFKAQGIQAVSKPRKESTHFWWLEVRAAADPESFAALAGTMKIQTCD